MKPTKAETAAQFDKMSRAYATSDGHARGSDLALLVELLAPHRAMRVLDVATGAGHTAAAVALHVADVVAVDIAPAMLARTRELCAQRDLGNVSTALQDAEALHFPDACFDAVTCRIAPHHFPNLQTAIGEIARVLKPGGAFVVEDSIVPQEAELADYFNRIEQLRDPTHVRSLTRKEWVAVLEGAGFTVVAERIHRKRHDVADWIARAGLNAAHVERVYAALEKPPAGAIDRFGIEYANGRALAFRDEKLLARAEKTQAGLPPRPGTE